MNDLTLLLGTFDENLTALSRELGVEAFVEGVKIRLSGEAEAVALAKEVLSALQQLAQNG